MAQSPQRRRHPEPATLSAGRAPGSLGRTNNAPELDQGRNRKWPVLTAIAMRATISCTKSEIKLSSSHERLRLFRMVSIVGFRPGGSKARQKSAEKIFAAKIPRNPLKSLDSDERIQGNPRKSKAQNQGFSQRNGNRPRKPKSTRSASGPLPRQERTRQTKYTII